MDQIKGKKVLISGASIAGLSTAWWMNKIGYQVTVIELAGAPRTAGAAIDLKGITVDISKRMGIFEKLKLERLHVERVEFKNSNDMTEGSVSLKSDSGYISDDELEIERDKFIGILYQTLQHEVEFIFNNSITEINERRDDLAIMFKEGPQRNFDLLFGCDGIHSAVRRIWFGPETDYSYFLRGYFSITVLDKLLIEQKTMQMYNVPDKAITLNAYKNKTDVIFCFYSEKEILYDYRNSREQRQIINDTFTGGAWRTAELLKETMQSDNFYFDKFCQIKMHSWTKGRVALVGDAGYCASPAAGMGGSLSINGAAALADALEKNRGNFIPAFNDYNNILRPFIEEVQLAAETNVRDNFIPRSEEAISKRNTQTLFY